MVAVARGTTHAKRVASYLFEDLIQDTASLIKHLKIVDAYCQIGFYETKFVLSILNRIYRDSITTEVDVEKRTWFVKEVTPLLNRLVSTDEPQEPIQFLAHIALDLEEANADPSFLLKEVLKTTWGFDSSQDLNLDSAISFWTVFSEAVENVHSRPGTQHRLLLRAAAELTKPEHDCAFLSPTARRTLHFVRASLAPQQYELLISNVMSTFRDEYQFQLDHLPLWFSILKNIKKIALKERNSTDKLKTSNPLNLTGVKLCEIAESAQWGFYTGQRSKHVQSIIDKMSTLSRSNENVLQEVGQAGLAFYPPLLEKILKEERRKDILGEL